MYTAPGHSRASKLVSWTHAIIHIWQLAAVAGISLPIITANNTKHPAWVVPAMWKLVRHTPAQWLQLWKGTLPSDFSWTILNSLASQLLCLGSAHHVESGGTCKLYTAVVRSWKGTPFQFLFFTTTLNSLAPHSNAAKLKIWGPRRGLRSDSRQHHKAHHGACLTYATTSGNAA